MRRATWRAERGVFSEVLRTMVQPAARAGPSFQASITSGKFHGMICARAADKYFRKLKIDRYSRRNQPDSHDDLTSSAHSNIFDARSARVLGCGAVGVRRVLRLALERPRHWGRCGTVRRRIAASRWRARFATRGFDAKRGAGLPVRRLQWARGACSRACCLRRAAPCLRSCRPSPRSSGGIGRSNASLSRCRSLEKD